MGKPDGLVIGESLIDILLDGPGVDEHAGGSPFNVAVGLGRLGYSINLATWFGNDQHGQMIIGQLNAAQVGFVPGSDGAARTSTATVSLGLMKVADYQFDLDWQMPPLPGELIENPPPVVHTGSIGATKLPGAEQVLDVLRRLRGRTVISFDPNIRPGVIGPVDQVRPLVEKYIGLADIVKVSFEDLDWLYPGENLDQALNWLALGPAILIVTIGGAGAFGMCRAGRRVVPPPNVGPLGPMLWKDKKAESFPLPRPHLVDTVGAGDAFMAGLLDGIFSLGLADITRRSQLSGLKIEELEELMRHATTAAGICLTRPGADPPWRRELPPLLPPHPGPGRQT